MWSSHQPSHPPDTVREGGILCRRFKFQVRPADVVVHLCDTLFAILFPSNSCLHPFISLLTCSIVVWPVVVVVVDNDFLTTNCDRQWPFDTLRWKSLTCLGSFLGLLFFQPVEFPLRVGSLCSLLTFLPCVVDLHTNKREHTDASLYTHLVLSVVLLQKEHLQSVQLLSEFFIEYSMWEANEKEATDKSRSRIAIPFIPFVRDYGPPSPWNFLCVAPNVNAMPPFGWR